MPHLNEREIGKGRIRGDYSLVEQRRMRGRRSVEKGLEVGGSCGECQGSVKKLRRRVKETMGR